jgi:16S rRNA (uracil1498-N3)-methyltransferase
MRRFFAEPQQCEGSQIRLDEHESQHLAQVLRGKPGEQVTILDGAGGVFNCEIAQVAKRRVDLNVLKRERISPLPYELILFQAIPKGKIMESIVQKATELGARRIVPILTERTVVDIDADSAKVEKWRAVAIESIKQCGSAWLPKIEAPVQLKDALKKIGSFALVASLHEGASEIHQYFQGKSARHVQIWVGPEGDFTPAEVSELIQAGARAITLGPLTLRCDTAAIGALVLAAHYCRRGAG